MFRIKSGLDQVNSDPFLLYQFGYDFGKLDFCHVVEQCSFKIGEIVRFFSSVWFISIPRCPLGFGFVNRSSFLFFATLKDPFFSPPFFYNQRTREPNLEKKRKNSNSRDLSQKRVEIELKQKNRPKSNSGLVENGKSNYFSSPHTDGDEDGHG